MVALVEAGREHRAELLVAGVLRGRRSSASSSVVTLSGGSLVNALISLCLGLLIATVGVDAIYGAERFAFGLPVPAGRHRVPAGDGGRLRHRRGAHAACSSGSRPRRRPRAAPGRASGQRSRSSPNCCAIKATFLRGTATGIVVGSRARGRRHRVRLRRLRHRGPVRQERAGSWAAARRRASSRRSPRPRRRSAVRWCRCSTMGIPGSGATAIILAAFLLHGIQPGPQVFVSSTELIYTVFASVFVARDRHVHPRLLRDPAAVQGARCARGHRLGVRRRVLLRRARSRRATTCPTST